MAGLHRAILGAINGVALAAGVLCLAAALLAQAGQVYVPIDVLSHFAPLWLAGGLICALCGMALATGAARARQVAIGVLTVAAAVVLMSPELLRRRSPPATSGEGQRIRLIQFNAWELNREPEVAADWIAEQRPDVVTIEELTPPLRTALERRGFRFQKGMNQTIAIFSRAAPAPAPFIVPVADWPVLPLFARESFIAPGGRGAYNVVAVHLEWPIWIDALQQARALAGFLDLYASDRLIVAGDFNLTPWSSMLRRFDRSVGVERRDLALPTWPARVSVAGRLYPTPAYLPIDHVYAGSAWRTVAVRRGPFLGSDHYPVVLDLSLTQGAAHSPPPAVARLVPDTGRRQIAF
jgi:endonuclease/exonuclease/phosphatase (EEP) superfamily protein YafD